MDRRPLVDPDEGRSEALVVGAMALAAALALVGLAASIGTVTCPNNGTLFLPSPGLGIGAGVVLALAALSQLACARRPGRHLTALAAAAALLLTDGVLLVFFVRFAQDPTAGCYTF